MKNTAITTNRKKRNFYWRTTTKKKNYSGTRLSHSSKTGTKGRQRVNDPLLEGTRKTRLNSSPVLEPGPTSGQGPNKELQCKMLQKKKKGHLDTSTKWGGASSKGRVC